MVDNPAPSVESTQDRAYDMATHLGHEKQIRIPLKLLLYFLCFVRRGKLYPGPRVLPQTPDGGVVPLKFKGSD
jgi:hypothetical protein